MHLVWERVQAGNVTGIVARRGEARRRHVDHSRLHAVAVVPSWRNQLRARKGWLSGAQLLSLLL